MSTQPLSITDAAHYWDSLGDTALKVLAAIKSGSVVPDSLDGQTRECGALAEELQDNLRALMVASRAYAGIYRRAAQNAPGDLANAQVKPREHVRGALR